MSTSRFGSDVLTEAARRILAGCGLAEDSAQTVAGSLVASDERGIASHGLMLLPMYVDRLLAGSVTTEAAGDVIVDLGAVAVIDAKNALGQLTGDQAMKLAIAKAKTYGVGAVAVRHAFHFGGAFRYVQQATSADCVGIAAANTRPLMPAPGGATAVVGNNPVAIGIPRGMRDAVVVDMALSEAALGKIRMANAESRPIPSTWATDADGAPTTDPAAALAGLLLPVGGPKGYGLALAIDALAGILGGGGYGSQVRGLYADVSAPNNCSHFFLALHVEAFGDPSDFAAAVDDLADQVGKSALAPGASRVLLPGQGESERSAEARVAGTPVDPSVLEGLRAAAARVGVVLPVELS